MMNSTPNPIAVPTITVDESGGITLPKSVQKELNLNEGDLIEIRYVKGQLKLRKKKKS